jgi:hypothetical protein
MNSLIDDFLLDLGVVRVDLQDQLPDVQAVHVTLKEI